MMKSFAQMLETLRLMLDKGGASFAGSARSVVVGTHSPIVAAQALWQVGHHHEFVPL